MVLFLSYHNQTEILDNLNQGPVTFCDLELPLALIRSSKQQNPSSFVSISKFSILFFCAQNSSHLFREIPVSGGMFCMLGAISFRIFISIPLLPPAFEGDSLKTASWFFGNAFSLRQLPLVFASPTSLKKEKKKKGKRIQKKEGKR